MPKVYHATLVVFTRKFSFEFNFNFKWKTLLFLCQFYFVCFKIEKYFSGCTKTHVIKYHVRKEKYT